MSDDITKLDHPALLQAMADHLRKAGSYSVAHVEECLRRLAAHEAIVVENARQAMVGKYKSGSKTATAVPSPSVSTAGSVKTAGKAK